MQNLFESRKANEHPVKLENLSPEKYGRAAYVDLHFTPSKLADNVLFKEVTTLKKYQDGTNKLREFQALNNFFKDRITQIEQERDGIETSLSQQITMYKKLVQEIEAKHQARLKEIQINFKEEIHKIILEKEEQAKYAQSEKEVLEQRINQLEQEIQSLRNNLGGTTGQLQDLNNEHEKLKIKYANIEDKLEKTEQKMKQDNERLKKQAEQLSRKLYISEVDAKKQLDNMINKKDKEIENLQRFHRAQLQKIENAKSNESLIRNQQIKDLRTTFEAEAKRLDEIINMKDRMIDNLTKENNNEKNNILQMTRDYQNQINNLSYQKSRLLQQVDQLTKSNTQLNFSINDLKTTFQRQQRNLQNYISELKEDLNIRLGFGDQNKLLCREIQRLRDILLESSMEMQKCKEEFLRMGSQNNQLIIQLRQLGLQNETLHRIKIERGQDTRRWKENYLLRSYK